MPPRPARRSIFRDLRKIFGSPLHLPQRREIVLLCLVLLAATPPARADQAPLPSTKASPVLSVPLERYRLPNGLTVILHEDHRAPTVVVDLWFRVGSKDERAGRSGFAHLFEHLMFMGTERVPNGRFDAIMEAAGGYNNASTSEDKTNYFEAGPSNLLETFLWLEADRLGTLADGMTVEKLDLQRDVVKNERRQSYENRPYGMVELVQPEHLYPASHPYHHPVIGSHQDLGAAGVGDVKDFFRSYYVPANASLVIDGDFRSDDARRLVEKHLGALPARPEPPHAEPPPSSLASPERVLLHDDVSLSRVVRVWLSPAGFSPGDAACELLAAMLGAGKSSRLYRALVYEQKLASSVTVEQRGNRYGGQLVITVTAQPGVGAAEIERALEREVAKLAAAPAGKSAAATGTATASGSGDAQGDAAAQAAEMERARAYVETQNLRAVEKPLGMAEALSTFEYFLGDPRRIETELLGRYERLTLAEVMQEARAVLGKPSLTLVVEPQGKTPTGKAAAGGAR